MYLSYRNQLYELIKFQGKWLITTYKKEKCDSTFIKEWDYYAKEYNETDADIQDMFAVTYRVCWDSKLNGVDTKWDIFTDKEYLKGNQVLLRFTHGLLPGWKAEEQTVCTKYVDLHQCYGFTVRYEYSIKNGEKLEEHFIEEIAVNQEQFIQMWHKYQSENI